MTPPAALRAATREDAPRIAELLAEAHLSTAGLDAAPGSFLVAVIEGKIVGTIGLEVFGASGLLRSAAVERASQGKGIGGLLVSGVIAEANALGLGELVLMTTAAAPYFQRMGFAAVERASVRAELFESEQFQGGCPSSAVCMRLDLAASAGARVRRNRDRA